MNKPTIPHLLAAAALAACAVGTQAATTTYTASFVVVDPETGTVELDGFGRVISSSLPALSFSTLAGEREPFFDTWQIDTSAIPAGPYNFTALSVDAAGSVLFTSVTFNSIDEAGRRDTILFAINADGTQAVGNGSFTVRTNCPIESCVWIDIAGSQAAGVSGEGYGGSFTAVLVPEPQTYLLMLAGLGAVGVLARRRRRQEAAA